MKEKRKGSFVEQAAILTIAMLTARVLGFMYRLPLTNMLGDQGLAYYQISYNIYLFFLVLSSAGLPAAISKMVSERRARGRHRDAHRVFKASLAIAAALGALCMLALFFGAGFLAEFTKSPESYYSLITLAPTVLIVAVLAVFRGYSMGMGDSRPNAASQVVDQLFNAVFSIVCAYLLMKNALGVIEGDPEKYRLALGAAGGTLGTGIGALSGLLFIAFLFLRAYPGIRGDMGRDVSAKPEGFSKIAGELAATAVPIVIGAAVVTITNLIDSFMVKGRLIGGLGMTRDMADSLFGQLTGKAYTLTNLPVAISTAMAAAAIPSVAASNVISDMKRVKLKINSAMRIAMMFSIPAAVGLMVLAPQILALLYPNYPEGGLILRISAFSVIFLSLTQITTGMLQAVGKVRVPVFAMLCGIAVKVPLNYFLIALPSVNINGAVISTIACYTVAVLIDWRMLKAAARFKPDSPGILIKPLVSAAAMGMAVYVAYHLSFYVLHINAVSVLFAVLCGCVVYFAAMALVGGLNKDDMKQIPIVKKYV